MDPSSASSSASGPDTPPKKKQKWYPMALNREWLEDPDFKKWLVVDPEDSAKCRCAPCRFTFRNPNKSALNKHAETAVHQKAVKASAGVKLTKFFTPQEKTRGESHSERIARCEMIVTGFFAEHEIPFLVADHFWDMLRHAAPDSAIIKSAAAKRTKLSYLMVHGLATEETERVSAHLKNKRFSIMIDESTDISIQQVMALVVRVYDPKNKKTQDLLLDLVEPRSGTAQGLFETMMGALEAAGVDKRGIIGLGADNCSTMMGASGGVRALLEEVVPDLFVMGCVCHSLALCAGHAARCLPSWLEMLVKDIASYLSRSPKRRDALSLVQEAVNAPCHQIPKVAMTRWLSRGAVLQRILEQWEALKLFFSSEAITIEGKENRAADISYRLEQQGTKHMLLFVHFVIKKVDVLNLLFQSEDYQLHQLYRKMTDGYRTLLSLYVLPEILDSVPLHKITPDVACVCKRIEDISLGGRCESLLLEEPLREAERNMRMDALDFLQQLCCQIKRRFDMDPNGTLSRLCVLDPAVAMLQAGDKNRPHTLAPLMVRFKHLVPEDKRDDLNDEWRELPVVLATAKIQDKPPLTPPVFWSEVAELTNGAGEPRFPALTGLFFDLMSLPHSSAAVERVFSQVNRVKTAKTNRLTVETTRGRLLARQAVRGGAGDGTCSKYEPSASTIADAVAGGPHRRQRQAAAKAGVSLESSTETDNE